MAKEAIDAKLLKGIRYSTSEARKVKDENGVEKTRYTPIERDATPEDVLDWADNGATVTVVMKDGKKYRVPRSTK